MGESFKNLVSSIREKMAKPLYDSDGVCIMRFEDSKERPRSEEFRKAHPELYNFLLTRKPVNKFKVGIIHLDGDGFISKQRAEEGATPVSTAFNLESLIHAGLLKIANEMKNNPNSELGKLEYLTAGSLFFRARKIAENLGFEIFEINDDEAMKFNSASHRRKEQTYNISNALGTTGRDLSTIKKKSAKVGLISKQTLLALSEKQNTLK